MRRSAPSPSDARSPGVGKETVARALCDHLKRLGTYGDVRVITNHLLIDPAAALFDRDDPAYQPFRRGIRQALFNALIASTGRHRTIIFTDNQSTTAANVCKSYASAAEAAGARFMSVILHCSAEENERRLIGRDGGTTTKLRDVDILRTIRGAEDIYRFHRHNELILDASEAPACTAAAIASELS